MRQAGVGGVFIAAENGMRWSFLVAKTSGGEAMNAEQAARAIEEWVLKWKPTLTAERLGITKATLAAIVEGEQDVEADLLDVVEEWVQAEQEQQEQRRHMDWVTHHRRIEYGR